MTRQRKSLAISLMIEMEEDPYAEDKATLWILHYMLVVKAVSSIYRLFFVDLQREKKEFDKEQVLSFIKRKCNVPEQKMCLMKILLGRT